MPSFLEGGEIVGFEGDEGSIDHFPARHDDHIQAGVKFVSPEQFPGQPFGPVPLDGCAHLASRGDAQSCLGATILHHVYGHEPAVDSHACVVRVLEVGPPPHALRPAERLAQMISLRRQPSAASAPWRDGA